MWRTYSDMCNERHYGWELRDHIWSKREIEWIDVFSDEVTFELDPLIGMEKFRWEGKEIIQVIGEKCEDMRYLWRFRYFLASSWINLKSMRITHVKNIASTFSDLQLPTNLLQRPIFMVIPRTFCLFLYSTNIYWMSTCVCRYCSALTGQWWKDKWDSCSHDLYTSHERPTINKKNWRTADSNKCHAQN